MTVTDRFSGSALRWLAVLGAMAMALALLPQTAGAQDADPNDACPEDAPEAGFTDRDTIPPVHRLNVDCAAHFEIVRGFADNTYRPRLQVRRDQMASFIALTLDSAGVSLPAGESDTFTDVPDTNVHSDNVNRLAEAGIVEGGPLGRPANEYGPALRTRRDQMASFLMRAAGYALHNDVNAFDSTDQQFTDVPSGNVHFPKVNAAAENDIALGTGGGLYQPRLETRRDQMASFVIRLLNFILAGAVEADTLTLSPQVETNTVGTSHTVTSTVTANGVEVPGHRVLFEVHRAGVIVETATGTVPPAGQSVQAFGHTRQFTYTGPATPATDTIVACTFRWGQAPQQCDANNEDQLTDTATKHWVLAQANLIALTPETATNPVAQTHTVTATVTAAGTPVATGQVRFEVRRDGTLVETATVAVGAGGLAAFSYSGPVTAATDDIVACTTPQGPAPAECTPGAAGQLTATATKNWVVPT